MSYLAPVYVHGVFNVLDRIQHLIKCAIRVVPMSTRLISCRDNEEASAARAIVHRSLLPVAVPRSSGLVR